MGYRLMHKYYRYQNSSYTTNKNSSTLYISCYGRNLEIKLLVIIFMVFFAYYYRETNLYKALLLFVDFT